MHWHSGVNRIVAKDISSHFRALVLSGTYRACKNRGFQTPPSYLWGGRTNPAIVSGLKSETSSFAALPLKHPHYSLLAQWGLVTPNLFAARDIDTPSDGFINLELFTSNQIYNLQSYSSYSLRSWLMNINYVACTEWPTSK